MRRFLLFGLIAVVTVSAAPAGKGVLIGFAPERSEEQRKHEAKFDSLLRADNLREWMKRMSARPHHVGAPHDKANAEFMASLFRSWGYETEIETFKVLFPTPLVRELELLGPTKYKARLEEPALAQDATSAVRTDQLPPFNMFSCDGDVTGELVYVNYGVPKDYEELALRGVDVKGKIVIARYGGSWRGIKPKVAAEHGAIGCIIYSDPRDDGYYQGDEYPKGGWRNQWGVQRGSVKDIPEFSGDVLTPFVGATEDAKRLEIKDAHNLTKIPTLPISYGDALPLLKAIEGPMAPESWRGSLPTPYKIGPGPARVHLNVKFDWKLEPIYDVIAKMKGTEYPDEWIIRGNHHDAWVFGATDPVSGMVAVLEEARCIAELASSGWKPKRTIVFAAWDGEEPGLLGSVEWAELHADMLREKAAVYINSDSNSRGFLSLGGSQTLEPFVNEVARDVMDPKKGVSVAERMRAADIVHGDEDARKEARARPDIRIAPLGSGSDYTPFLQFLGIASLSIGYGDEDEYGQYHSIYDSFDHYVRFMDQDFSYGVALAQTGGRIVMRLAAADTLPFTFPSFADNLAKYVDDLQKQVGRLRDEAVERNRRLDDKSYDLFFDPKKTFVAPPRLDPVPHLNFAPLDNALEAVKAGAERYRKASEAAAAKGWALPGEKRAELDRLLYTSERALTRTGGLPGRPWYTHEICAPGTYTGYGVKTIPAVREAVEARKWKDADEQIVEAAKTLAGFAAQIDKASALLEGDAGR